MLTLENVSLSYGSFRALNGVTLNAKEGELVVLLGANGAGKSSIFLTTSGLHRAAGGSIKFRNTELVGMKPSQIVASGVVQCPEGRKLFPQMSVLKNLMLGAYVHRAYVLEGGRIVMEGDRDSLLNNEAVRKAYIGA
jgi:branched-chain amino acid transport system ATP-binding protein